MCFAAFLLFKKGSGGRTTPKAAPIATHHLYLIDSTPTHPTPQQRTADEAAKASGKGKADPALTASPDALINFRQVCTYVETRTILFFFLLVV